MRRGHCIPLLAVASVALAACGDGRGDANPLAPLEDPPEALELRLPAGALTAPLPARSTTTAVSPTSAPARIAEEEPIDATMRPLQQIFDPRTRAGFKSGFAYSLGLHEYIGNVGRIVTTAEATHKDRHLGSQSAERQDYTPFFFDWGMVKTIWEWAKIYTDYTCGMTVSGSSRHEASWQMFQGRSTTMWGKVIRSSQSTVARQGACSSETGGYEQAREEGGGLVCYYWVTYDLDTGEIVDAKLIACSNSTGARI